MIGSPALFPSNVRTAAARCASLLCLVAGVAWGSPAVAQAPDYESIWSQGTSFEAFLEAAGTLLLIKNGKIAYTGDLDGAMPMLDDLSICAYSETCEGETDAECYR